MIFMLFLYKKLFLKKIFVYLPTHKNILMFPETRHLFFFGLIVRLIKSSESEPFEHFLQVHVCVSKFIVLFCNEPPHGKTNNLHMRKQRRRSASASQ